VNRRSVYNYFQNKYLKYDIIYKIGLLIRHDFSKEFPDMFTSEQFELTNKQSRAFQVAAVEQETVDYWQEKYIRLLENYNEALNLSLQHKSDKRVSSY
jgi:hypothetical protein